MVINLTGPAQPCAVQVSFPGVPECDWGFGILQWTLHEESAAATLADLAAGRTTRWLLPWIPLMQGGAEAGIIEPWTAIALTEPDPQVRSTLGAFAVLFADLAGRADPWKQALEGWDMRTSQVVEEWREEGRLEAYRDSLRVQLEDRFGPLSAELLQRIAVLADVERLKTALRQVLHLHTLDELKL